MEPINAFAAEVIKEAIGTSRKKWALLIVALVAGAMGAMWLVRRTRSVEPLIAADGEQSATPHAESSA
jgi:hypothetical protein